MIKFILGFIAVVLMALVTYIFTQSEKKAEHKVAKKVETKVTKKQKVGQPKVSKTKVVQQKIEKHTPEKEDAMDELIASEKSIGNSKQDLQDSTYAEIRQDSSLSEADKQRFIEQKIYFDNQNNKDLEQSSAKNYTHEETNDLLKNNLLLHSTK